MRNNQPVTANEYVIGEHQYLISRTDLKGRITYANPAFIEVSGFSRDELMGAPHNIVRHPDMPAEAFADLWGSAKAGNTWTALVKNRRKNGDFYWVLATVTPTVENGAVTGYTSVRLKASEAQIAKAGALYAKFASGTARGLRMRQGQILRTGAGGWLRRLRLTTIRARLTGMIVTGAVLLAAVGGIGLYGMSASNAKLQAVYQGAMVPVSLLNDMGQRLDRNVVQVAEALNNPRVDVMQRVAADAAQNMSDLDRLWREFAPTVSADLKPQAERFNTLRQRFIQDGLGKTIDMLRSGAVEGAQQQYADVVKPSYGPLRDELNALMRLELTNADDLNRQAQKQFLWVRGAAIAGIGVGVLVLVVLGGILRRAVTKPLHTALEFSKQIAAGDLAAHIESTSRDEVGRLIFGLGIMKNSLRSIVSDVREGIDSINTASHEIAAGNTDLSARTEQQAASLEETASSMEELTATVKQNADNAKQASQLAVNASEIAARGGEVVGQVVGTMHGIATSSRKIEDIIGVIEGIAFQTNILALNAAVEAARAGEQGRGFAVVAGEVRSLAQRSAAAAKEIKGLIEDSTSKVEGGSRLVERAGQTMEEIVQAVKRVTDIMGEISAASAEQSSGIEQVNRAVTQMDEVTQQNAALVEEAAAAAGSLEEQAQRLKDAVSVFRLAQGAEPTPRRMSKAQLAAQAQLATSAAAAPVTPPALAKRGPADPGGIAHRRPPPASAEAHHEDARVLQLPATHHARPAAPVKAAKVTTVATAAADGDWEEF